MYARLESSGFYRTGRTSRSERFRLGCWCCGAMKRGRRSTTRQAHRTFASAVACSTPTATAAGAEGTTTATMPVSAVARAAAAAAVVVVASTLPPSALAAAATAPGVGGCVRSSPVSVGGLASYVGANSDGGGTDCARAVSCASPATATAAIVATGAADAGTAAGVAGASAAGVGASAPGACAASATSAAARAAGTAAAAASTCARPVVCAPGGGGERGDVEKKVSDGVASALHLVGMGRVLGDSCVRVCLRLCLTWACSR